MLFYPSQTCEDDNQHTVGWQWLVSSQLKFLDYTWQKKTDKTFLQTNHDNHDQNQDALWCQYLPSCSVLGIPDASHDFVWSATYPVHCYDLVMNSYGLRLRFGKLKVQMQVNKKRIIYRNIHLIYVQYVRQYIYDMDVYIYIHSICYILVDFLCPSRAGRRFARQLPHSCLYLSLPPPTPTPFPKNNLQQISRLPSSTFKSPIKSIFHPHPKFTHASSTEKDWLSGAWSGMSVFQLPSSPPLILALTKWTGDVSAVSTEASMHLKQSEWTRKKWWMYMAHMDVSIYHVTSSLEDWSWILGIRIQEKTNTVMHIRPMPRGCPLCIWPPTGDLLTIRQGQSKVTWNQAPQSLQKTWVQWFFRALLGT